MFVPERERQKMVKMQQDRQYYEDLRKQIEEKNKNQGNFSQNTQNQMIVPRGGYQNQPNYIRDDMQNYQNYSRVHENGRFQAHYPSPYSQASSTLSREPLQNFPPPSIAPLNMQIIGINDDFGSLPSLPRQLNPRNGVDESSFKSRLESANKYVIMINDENKQNENKLDLLQTELLPDLQTSISNVDNELERIVSSAIPKSVDPSLDLITKNKQLLKDASNKFETLINNYEGNFENGKKMFSDFKISLQEITDKSKKGLMETRAEARRLKHCIEIDLQRLSEMEAIDAGNIETIAKYNTIFERNDSYASEMYAEMSRSVTDVIEGIQKQMALEIKRMSEARNRATAALHGQAELINSRGAEGVKANQEGITNVIGSFQTLINDLSESISTSLEETQSQTEDATSVICNKIDTLISESEDSFGTIRNESVSTIDSIRRKVLMERNAISSVIEREGEYCTKNQKLIKDKFVKFRELVDKESISQMESVKNKIEVMECNSKLKINEMVKPVKDDTALIVEKGIQMKRLENRVEELEGSVIFARQQIFEAVGSLQATFRSINTSIAEANEEFERRSDEIEEQLLGLEEIDRSQCIKKDDILRMAENMNNEVDARISFLENQISATLKSISELDETTISKSKFHGILPATAALQKAVDNVEHVQSEVVFQADPAAEINKQLQKIIHQEEEEEEEIIIGANETKEPIKNEEVKEDKEDAEEDEDDFIEDDDFNEEETKKSEEEEKSENNENDLTEENEKKEKINDENEKKEQVNDENEKKEKVNDDENEKKDEDNKISVPADNDSKK